MKDLSKKPNVHDLTSELFHLRDCLLDVSQTLRDLLYNVDDESRAQAEHSAKAALSKIAKS